MVRKLAIASRPSVQNIHALLAYANEAGVKEKFDARFGTGSAAAIIAAAEKTDTNSSVCDSIASLNKRVTELSTAIAAMPAHAATEGFEDLVARMDAVVQRIDSRPDPAPQTPSSAPVDFRPLVAAIAEMASEIKVLQKLQRANRRVITDINGNVTGVAIQE
jgi:hypothetical protein